MADVSESSTINVDLLQKIYDKFQIDSLKSHQNQAINSLLQNRDVFVGTRTGSGKSLVYECFLLLKSGTVVIIAPLVTIMSEQTSRLNNIGFKATYIGKDTSEEDEIMKGSFDFLFGSPESLVGDKKWRDLMLSSSSFSTSLIVIDEAHTVIQWGEPSQNEPAFREMFSRIGELRSLCSGVPMLALTATSGPLQRRKILKSLCFNDEADLIIESPDRTNIKISVKRIKNTADPKTVFGWLFEDIRQLGQKLPRHVVFCEAIRDVASLHEAFQDVLGKSKLFNMYHSKTKERVKEMIREDMNCDGNIRVLICTNAAGMGVNFYGLNNIIHYGIPRDMDTFVQQMGRCGRGGELANELILYKKHASVTKKVEKELIDLVESPDVCRHKIICDAYIVGHDAIDPVHNCCDLCEVKCSCESTDCPCTHKVMEYEVSGSDSDVEDLFKRDTTVGDRLLLRRRLKALKASLATTVNTTLRSEILHGLTDDTISSLVDNADIIFCVEDITANVPIWSNVVAQQVFSVFDETFDDCTLPEFESGDESYMEM